MINRTSLYFWQVDKDSIYDLNGARASRQKDLEREHQLVNEEKATSTLCQAK